MQSNRRGTLEWLIMDDPGDRRALVTLLLVLTGVTGLIDAVSYLRLGHVFVANMTGNVVFLGFALLPGSGLSTAASGIAIPSFLAGAVLGGWLATRLSQRPRHWLVAAFAIEAGLMVAVAVLASLGVLTYHGGRALITIAVLAVGFGLQNATIRRLAARDLTTTVLTLTLTGLAADSTLAGGIGQKPLRRLGSILAMLAGAATGALLLRFTITGVLALAATLVALVTAGFATTLRPAT
jgi:uncharacterized membrane protein YoaK (UPF0700 family)